MKVSDPHFTILPITLHPVNDFLLSVVYRESGTEHSPSTR